jgi:hypothetical protein
MNIEQEKAVLAMYAMAIAEGNLKEATKKDETKTPEEKKERKEKIDQANREINAANELAKGNIDGAFASLCYFRDR